MVIFLSFRSRSRLSCVGSSPAFALAHRLSASIAASRLLLGEDPGQQVVEDRRLLVEPDPQLEGLEGRVHVLLPVVDRPQHEVTLGGLRVALGEVFDRLLLVARAVVERPDLGVDLLVEEQRCQWRCSSAFSSVWSACGMFPAFACRSACSNSGWTRADPRRDSRIRMGKKVTRPANGARKKKGFSGTSSSPSIRGRLTPAAIRIGYTSLLRRAPFISTQRPDARVPPGETRPNPGGAAAVGVAPSAPGAEATPGRGPGDRPAPRGDDGQVQDAVRPGQEAARQARPLRGGGAEPEIPLQTVRPGRQRQGLLCKPTRL